MNKYLLLILIAVLLSSCEGQEETTKKVKEIIESDKVLASGKDMIKSAFGITLGQTFKTSSDNDNMLQEGEPLSYKFTPKNAIKMLTNYSVTVTPVSHKVVEIIAWKQMDDYSKCDAEKLLLFSILERKYFGVVDTVRGFLTTIGEKITQDKRSVSAYCIGTTLYLSYEDIRVKKLLNEEKKALDSELKVILENQKTERILSEINKINSSGL